jgi:hypothetical protein
MPLLVIEGERRLAKTVLLSVAACDRGRAKLGQKFALRGALCPASSRADEIGAVEQTSWIPCGHEVSSK